LRAPGRRQSLLRLFLERPNTLPKSRRLWQCHPSTRRPSQTLWMDLLEMRQIDSLYGLFPRAQPVFWSHVPVKPPEANIANVEWKILVLPKVRPDYSHAPSSVACLTVQVPPYPPASPSFSHTPPGSGQKHHLEPHSDDISENAAPVGLGLQRLPKTAIPRKGDELHYKPGITQGGRAVDHKPDRLAPGQVLLVPGNPGTSGTLSDCSLHKPAGRANPGQPITI
jgi:hypothetical protein